MGKNMELLPRMLITAVYYFVLAMILGDKLAREFPNYPHPYLAAVAFAALALLIFAAYGRLFGMESLGRSVALLPKISCILAVCLLVFVVIGMIAGLLFGKGAWHGWVFGGQCAISVAVTWAVWRFAGERILRLFQFLRMSS